MNSPTIKPASMFLNFPRCDCATEAEHESGASPCCSADHWRFALSSVRKSIFNSSSCAVSSPSIHLIAYEKEIQKTRNGSEHPLPNSFMGCLNASFYNFNSEPLSSEDIFAYRRSRSEHLIIRLLQNFAKHASNHSFVRLSAGIFLVQKYEAGESEFPSPRTISNALDFFGHDDTPIDTFSFNDLFNDMVQQTILPKQQQNTFLPCTYTLGVRYTNPYNNMRDVLVRGNIPLWCQTLFITECMRLLPIQQGTTRKGILPFAKDIEFKFGALQVDDPYPDLLIMFERFAMELSDPHLMFEIPSQEASLWKTIQINILDSVLYCEIPDDTAIIITKLADEWATSQGIPVP